MCERPKLSVITFSRNQARFIQDCIHSVQRQSYTNYEHIVVDGASTDGTVEILKRYPHLIWISEKDSCPEEAFAKGVKMSRGDYITVCPTSDGFLDTDWFAKCVKILDEDIETSLVWGFPQWMSERGALLDVAYYDFHSRPVPQKYDWFLYWLRCGALPADTNYCFRKNVFVSCATEMLENPKMGGGGEWAYNFSSRGYLMRHIDTIASFARMHQGQVSQAFKKKHTQFGNYQQRRLDYLHKLTGGELKHQFRDGMHRPIETPEGFRVKMSLAELATFKMRRLIFWLKVIYYGIRRRIIARYERT